MTSPDTSLEALINKFIAYTECEEWHMHTTNAEEDLTANADNNDGHMDYDEDKFKADLNAWALTTFLEIAEHCTHRTTDPEGTLVFVDLIELRKAAKDKLS